jgi:3-oxoacyl-[acyl-carrier protein] reductase
MLLKNKNAIITGCNRGIGKAILELFVKQGASIVACIRKPDDDFINFINELEKKYSVKIYIVLFDLNNNEEIKTAIKTIASLKLRIDILVNNAGFASGSFFQMARPEDIQKNMQINFLGVIYFIQSISRLMAKYLSGSIINITSVSGIIGDIGTLSYGSSKAAMNFATKNIAQEMGKFNIRVNAIAPSITKTDMLEQMDLNSIQKLKNLSALKREAEPIEIANVALFLASDMSTFITSQVIRVDGGLLI